ncbi:MAG: aldo/keto reductase [Phycisphaerales bacterium]
MVLCERALGSTGIRVPAIGLGTVKLGRNAGVKYPGSFELPSDREALALLERAGELGVRLLDTAPAYGVSEERLGRLLGEHRSLGGRDAWVIATKAGEEFDAERGGSRFDFSSEGVTRSVHRSLERLRTDRLDIVLLHSDGRDEWILRESGGLEALVALRERGLVRAVGISSKTPEGAVLGARMCDVVMLTLNPRERGDEAGAQEAHRRGVGVMVKKALLSGHVDGSLTPDECIAHALGVEGVRDGGVVIVGTLSAAHLAANARSAAGALRSR